MANPSMEIGVAVTVGPSGLNENYISIGLSQTTPLIGDDPAHAWELVKERISSLAREAVAEAVSQATAYQVNVSHGMG